MFLCLSNFFPKIWIFTVQATEVTLVQVNDTHTDKELSLQMARNTVQSTFHVLTVFNSQNLFKKL